MTALESTIGMGTLTIAIVVPLLLLVHKMHNGRVDSLDKRESDNHKSLQAAILEERRTRTEERRIAEERDERIFDKLDKVTDKLGDLNASMAGNFVSKEDCNRCKEG